MQFYMPAGSNDALDSFQIISPTHFSPSPLHRIQLPLLPAGLNLTCSSWQAPLAMCQVWAPAASLKRSTKLGTSSSVPSALPSARRPAGTISWLKTAIFSFPLQPKQTLKKPKEPTTTGMMLATCRTPRKRARLPTPRARGAPRSGWRWPLHGLSSFAAVCFAR